MPDRADWAGQRATVKGQTEHNKKNDKPIDGQKKTQHPRKDGTVTGGFK